MINEHFKHNRLRYIQLIILLATGSSSVWLSYLFGLLDWKSSAIGFITIVISTVVPPCGEKILFIIDKGDNSRKLEAFLNFAAALFSLIICIVVLSLISKEEKCASNVIAFVCFLLIPTIWWYQNRNNDNYNEKPGTEALGGNNF